MGAEGKWSPADAAAVNGGDDWFGENAVAVDLDGDLDLDLVHLDTNAGPDGVFGSSDDSTRVISTLMKGRWKTQP